MGAVQVNLKKLLGAFFFLPHNTGTNHRNIMRQKASSAEAIIPFLTLSAQVYPANADKFHS